jgi:Micrococcal nuclease (thermonuclease) homologs
MLRENRKSRKKGIDQYDRVLGIVYLDELNLNQEMVKEGLAWYYNHYVEDPVLEELEKTARQQNVEYLEFEKSPHLPMNIEKSKDPKVR